MNRNFKWLAIGAMLVVALVALSLALFAKPVSRTSPSPSPFALLTPVASATLAPALSAAPSTATPEPTGSAAAAVQPTITWSPTSVEVILSPGESTTKNFTFSSDQKLRNVVIGPVPEIAGFLSVQPSTLASVPANTPQAFAVNFNIPATATLGTYNGTIHVRIGTQTLPQTLKVVVNVWTPFADTSMGVVLKVPPNFVVETSRDTAPNLIGGKVFRRPGSPAIVTIQAYSNPQNLSALDWFNSVLRGREFTGGFGSPMDGADTIRQTTINGVAAVEVVGNIFDSTQRRLFFVRLGAVIEFGTSFPNEIAEPQEVAVMLQTLRFL